MDAVCVLLPDGAFADPAQGSGNFCLCRQMGEIFGVLDVLSRFRKEQDEFLVRRLEEAERTIQRSIDNLDILHALTASAIGDSDLLGINSSIRLIGWPSAILASVSWR